MPLLGKKPFNLAKPLTYISVDKSVFVIEHTGECFQSKDEYEKRIKMYNENIWTCQSTGHANLTHERAWKSEQESYQALKKNFPECMEKPVLEIVHHSTKSLDILIDKSYVKINSMFFPGDCVHFKVKHGGRIIRGRILKIDFPAPENLHPLNDKENSASAAAIQNESSPRKSPPKMLPYKYNIRLLEEDKIISSVPAEDLSRCDRPPNKDLLRLFIRSHAIRHGTNPNSPWIVESKLVKKYSLPGKFAEFLLSSPKLTSSSSSNIEESKKRKVLDSTPVLKKKKLKLELKPLNHRDTLLSYSKRTKTSVTSQKVRMSCENEINKEKSSHKTKTMPLASVKCKSEATSSPLPELDHSYSSPSKPVASVISKKANASPDKKMKLLGKVTKTKTLKAKEMSLKDNKPLVKRKSKFVAKQESDTVHQTPTKVPRKIDAKSKSPQSSLKKIKSVTTASKCKLKQMTLYDLPSKTIKKKHKIGVLEVNNSNQDATSNSVVKKIKLMKSQKVVQQLQWEKMAKKISDLRKEKKPIAYHLTKLAKMMNPQQYSQLPEDIRNALLKRLAFCEERSKLAGMSADAKAAYMKEKRGQRKLEKEKKDLVKPVCKYLVPLPDAKLVPTPECIPNELFGDVVMVVEFINCFSELLMPGEPYPVQSDLLLQSLGSGNEGFGYLSRVLLILLQTLLQDQIAEDYEELGVKLSNLPINIFTSTELVRLCLRAQDEHSNDDSYNSADDMMEVPEAVLSLLESAEIYELACEDKLKILTGLCHRIMSSYSVQDYTEQKKKETDEFWRQSKKFLDENGKKEKQKDDKKETVDELASKNGNSDETSKKSSEPSDGLTIPHFYGLPDVADSNGDDSNQERNISLVVRQRRVMALKAQEERLKKLEEEKERKIKDAEEQKKIREKKALDNQFSAALSTLKLCRRQEPIGIDRNYTRYWIFCHGTPGLYLEKGWFKDNSVTAETDKASLMKNSHGSDSDDDDPLINYVQESRESSYPPPGPNLWFQFDSMEEVDELIRALSIDSPCERALLAKIKKRYDEINRLFALKKTPRLELKEIPGNQELLDGFKKELMETENRVRAGMLGGVPDFKSWKDQLDSSTCIQDLLPCLLETRRNVLPRNLKKIIAKESSQTASDSSETYTSNLSSHQQWTECVKNCITMSRLHVLLGVLDACIKWEKSTENARCKICRRNDNELILCDNCNQAFHLFCLRPALLSVPQGDWLCTACQPLNERQNTRLQALQKQDKENEIEVPEQRTLRPRKVNSQEFQQDESSEEEESSSEEEEEEENLECCLCGGDEDVICCCKCLLGFHTFCHEPPLSCKPRGNWVCNPCQSGTPPLKMTLRSMRYNRACKSRKPLSANHKRTPQRHATRKNQKAKYSETTPYGTRRSSRRH